MTSPAGSYSAGTIFLQVVPSFRNAMRNIGRDAREYERALADELGDSDEIGKAVGKNVSRGSKKAVREAGEEAGEEYAGRFRETLKRSLKKASKELGALKPDLDTEDVEKKIRQIEARLKKIADLEIGVDLTSSEMIAELARLELLLAALRDKSVDIEVRTNLGSTLKDIEAVRKDVEALSDKKHVIEPEVRGERAERRLGALQTSIRKAAAAAQEALGDITARTASGQADLDELNERFERLKNVEIGVDMDTADVLAEAAMLDARLELLENDPVEIEAAFNAGVARAQIAQFIAKVQSENPTIHVDVDTDKVRRGFGDAAGSLRIFNALILAVVTVGPVLVPLLAVLAAGAVALGAAFIGAAAGIGVLILGFSGIGGAVKAINDAQQNAAKDAKASAKAIGDAQKGIARDSQASARAIESAQKGVVNSGKAVADAQKNAARAAKASARSIADAARSIQDAEEAVEDARRSGARAAESAAQQVQRALDGQRRAERVLQDAQRDALRAQERLTQARAAAEDQLQDMALRARGGALAERQALIDLFEAEIAYRNAMNDGSATNLEREQASITLERARLQIEQVRLENGRLAEEQAEVAVTGVEGTNQVIAAREGLEAANERVSEAERGIGEAAQDVQRAQQDQARSAADSARSIEKAQRRVADAQVAYADAVEQASISQADSAEAIDQALSAQADSQAAYAQTVQDSLASAAEAQEAYTEAVNETSTSQEKLREELEKLGPAGQAFAFFLAGLKDEFRGLRDAVQEGLLPGVQRSIENLLPYLPQITDFLRVMGVTLGNLFERFSEFLTTNPAMVAFFEMLGTYAPIFTTLFGEVFMELFELLAILAVAFAPLAESMIRGLVRLLDTMNAFLESPEGQEGLQRFMDYVREVAPDVGRFLQALVVALVDLGIALAPYAGQLLLAFISFFEFISGLDPKTLGAFVVGLLIFISVIQILAGVIGGLAASFKILGFIIGVVAFAFNVGVVAAAGIVFAIVAVIGILVLAYFKFEWFRNFVDFVFKAILSVARFAFEGIKFVWDNVLSPVLNAIGILIKVVAQIFTTSLEIIRVAFGAVFDWMAEYWARFLNTGLGKALQTFWSDYILPAWRAAVDNIRGIWHDIVDLFKGGVTLVVDIINNGIIDPINKLAEAVGVSKDSQIERIPKPFQGSSRSGDDNRTALAAGGFVPGFSATPTADNIPAMLTAGEYVLPVHAVKLLRAKFGDQFMDLLRGGLPGFAAGGLVEFGRMLQLRGARVAEHPAFGGVRGRHAPNSLHYSGNAIDVNTRPGTSAAEQRELAAFIPLAAQYGLRSIFMTTGHYGHAHFDTGRSGNMVGNLLSGASGALGSAVGAVSSRIGGFLSGLQNAAGDLLDTPMKFLTDKLLNTTGISELREMGGFGKVALSAIGKPVTWAIDWLRDKAGAVGDFFEGKDDKPPVLYDQGGVLPPGLTTVLNATGRPEAVFTSDQLEALTRTSGQGGDAFHWHDASGTPEEFAEAIMFKKRVQARGGVYADRL